MGTERRRRRSGGCTSIKLCISLSLGLLTSGRACTFITAQTYDLSLTQNVNARVQDFKECFPLWSEDQPRGIEGVHSTLASYTERFITVRRVKVSLYG